MKLELHFHTEESSPCGKVPAKEGIQQFKEAGYDGIAITDHFSEQVFGTKKQEWRYIVDQFLSGYSKAFEMAKKIGVKVYLGMEIRFPENDNDFLVYGITEEFLYRNPFVYLMNIKEFYDLAKLNNLCVIQAHPFRDGCRPVNPNYLDGVEIWNGNPRHNSRNYKAILWADRFSLIKTIGSDYHRSGDLQLSGMEIEELPENSNELAKILLKQQNL